MPTSTSQKPGADENGWISLQYAHQVDVQGHEGKKFQLCLVMRPQSENLCPG